MPPLMTPPQAPGSTPRAAYDSNEPGRAEIPGSPQVPQARPADTWFPSCLGEPQG